MAYAFHRNRLAVSLLALLAAAPLCAPLSAADKGKLAGAEVELAADQISYDAETGDVIALGRVRLTHEGYVLEAGEIRYNEKTGHAEALRAVTLTTPRGDQIVAPQVSLDDNLKRAFVEDIRLILEDGAQVRALKGERDENTGITSFDRAVYSPCDTCREDGTRKKPLWQLKAVRVVHDRGKKRLYYKDASLEILGVPVFWTPWFSHPDPTVERASGLLPLEMKTTKNLGFVAGLPYHHVFSQSQDVTLTPTLTTQEGLVLSAEYRHHVGYGQYSANGSVTYAKERDDSNMLTGGHEWRGHISSEGVFNHSSRWRSTYQVNWTSDDTYLRRYDISYADTLMSEYKLEGFYGPSYVSARTMAFQGLRLEDIAGKTGFALPLIDAEYVMAYKPLGGTVRLHGNALALYRTDGLDTQRLSVSADWQKRWITPKGFVVDADALVRTDLYRLSEIDAPDDAAFLSTSLVGSDTEWRNLARLTGTVTWPLVKIGRRGTHTLEPILEVTVSPERKTASDNINEDSRAFELNDINLFSADRTTGYDLWEDGTRLTYGMRWRFDGSKFQSRVMLGQSWRITGSDILFADGAGLEGDFSDIVGRVKIVYQDWIDLEHRFRLDDASFAIRRNEIDLKIGTDRRGVRLGYLKLDRDLNFINREDREEIRADAYYHLAKGWGLTGGVTHRLKGAVIDGVSEGSGGISYNVGVTYANECIEMSLRLKETFTEDRDIEPGTSILFRLKLKNLG